MPAVADDALLDVDRLLRELARERMKRRTVAAQLALALGELARLRDEAAPARGRIAAHPEARPVTDPPPKLVNPLTGRVVESDEEREMIERVMAEKAAGRAGEAGAPPDPGTPPRPGPER